MLPDPLHPLVVHFPIAFAVLIPVLAAAFVVAIATGLLPARAWLIVVLLQIGLVASTWVAIETGEADEERVERVVADDYIEPHEEAAKRLLIAAGITAALMALGLMPDRLGRSGRLAGTLAALVVFVSIVKVGHSGGELVYRHGAANAYTAAPADAGKDAP
jgi:uncharacterized membrane protein